MWPVRFEVTLSTAVNVAPDAGAAVLVVSVLLVASWLTIGIGPVSSVTVMYVPPCTSVTSPCGIVLKRIKSPAPLTYWVASPAIAISTDGLTVATLPIVAVNALPPWVVATDVTVPSAESAPVTVSVSPLLVTVTVPAPTTNTSSVVESEPTRLTPAVPFVEPTPDKV